VIAMSDRIRNLPLFEGTVAALFAFSLTTEIERKHHEENARDARSSFGADLRRSSGSGTGNRQFRQHWLRYRTRTDQCAEHKHGPAADRSRRLFVIWTG
jgi:hypothetical protein